MQAARDNIKDPPGIFVKVGIETMRGALKFIEHDLPRALSDVDDMHLLGDLAEVSTTDVPLGETRRAPLISIWTVSGVLAALTTFR